MLILVLLTILFFRIKMNRTGHFHEEVEREVDAKYKVASFVLMQSGAIEQRRRKQRRKPWIFRNSNQWFKQRSFHHVVVEHFVKAWIRKPQNLFTYLRFLGFSNVALLLFPGGWNFIVLLLVMFLFDQMARVEWEAFEQSSFSKMLARDPEDYAFSRNRILSLLLVPGYQAFVSPSIPVTLVLAGITVFLLIKPWLKTESSRELT